MNRRGFTFVELIVAMTLMGVVSTAIYKLLNNNQRVYREQATRIDLNQNVRAAVSILPAELRELDASDPNGSDILAMTSSSLTYAAMRNVYFLCQAPNTATLQVTVGTTPWFGNQAISVTNQRFLVFYEGDASTRNDDAWLHANSTVSATGTACPGGAASVTLTLTGVTAAQLAGVTSGAPIRGYERVQISRYQDATGAYWIGQSIQNKATDTWSAQQPLVGPITSTGLTFTYYDAAGAVTASTSSVARIAISVTGQTAEPVRGSGSTMQYATSSLVTQVALRNNRRF